MESMMFFAGVIIGYYFRTIKRLLEAGLLHV